MDEVGRLFVRDEPSASGDGAAAGGAARGLPAPSTGTGAELNPLAVLLK